MGAAGEIQRPKYLVTLELNKIYLNQLTIVNNLRKEVIEAYKLDSLLQEYKD